MTLGPAEQAVLDKLRRELCAAGEMAAESGLPYAVAALVGCENSAIVPLKVAKAFPDFYVVLAIVEPRPTPPHDGSSVKPPEVR